MGQVRSPESAALHILRAIEDEGAKFRAAEIAVVLPPEIALYLFNHKRERLSAIEARYAMRVTFNADPALTAANFRIEKVRAQTASALPAPASYGGVTERAAVQSTGVLPAAAAVVEAEEAEAEDEDEAVAPAGETAEEAGERKRKRRRRRGKRRPEGGESAAGAPVAEAPPADEAAAPGLPAEAPSELDLELAARFSGPEGDMPAGDSVDKVRRRRGRGGRRRRGEEAPVEQDVPVYADVAELFEAAERAEAALRVRAQPVREEYPVVEPEPAPEAPVAEALEGVAAVTVSTEAEAEQAEAEKPKPVWAPKVIGEDEPVAEKKRGWWRR
jgi:ribonuclease E